MPKKVNRALPPFYVCNERKIATAVLPLHRETARLERCVLKKTPVPQILSRRYGLYRLVELKLTEISRYCVNLNIYNIHFD